MGDSFDGTLKKIRTFFASSPDGGVVYIHGDQMSL
jgi:hypothetical protein